MTSMLKSEASEVGKEATLTSTRHMVKQHVHVDSHLLITRGIDKELWLDL
jgi:hypothetical protein